MKKFLIIIFCFSATLFAQYNPVMIDLGEGGVGSISKNGEYLCGSNYPSPPFLWSEVTGRIDVADSGPTAY